MRRTRVIAVSFLLVPLVLLLNPLSGTALASSHLWSRSFGDMGNDAGRRVAIDPLGRLLVAGNFYGTVDFGGGDLVSAGGSDIFIAKYSPSGTHLWSHQIGGVSTDYPYDVAIDADGNIIVIGNFGGTVDFGGGNLVSAGGSDIFLVKYNAAGTHQWSKRFGSTNNDSGVGVAVDAAGDVYIAASFELTVSFGGANLVSAGDADVCIAKYSSAGAHQWSERYGGTVADYAGGIDIVGGDVVATGYFSGTANFGGANLVSAGAADVFVARYTSAAGAHQWSNRYGGTSTDNATCVAASSAGDITVAGHFTGTSNFGGANLVSAGIFDAFVASYASDGSHQWSQRFGSTSNEFLNGLSVGSTGDVAITGSFVNTVSFGGAPLVSTSGSPDIFFAVFDRTGTPLWSRGMGGLVQDNGIGVTLDANGRILATGYFGDAADFGGGVLGSAGATDIFLAKYSPDDEAPLITSIGDIGNDQGRNVQIRFDRSGVDDADAAQPVTSYVAFRRDDPPPAGALAAPDPAAPDEALANGWTEVGSVLAYGEPSYGINVPTVGDSSISQGQYYSVFYIRASTDTPSRFWDSMPDSGYSVDNLAPGVPSGLVLAAGQLGWNESSDADFDYFTVYGANVDDFGAATLIDYTVAPGMDVTAASWAYYFVTATDFAGNESGPGQLAAPTGVGDTPRRHVLSISAYPNPFNPATTLRYTLPSRGRATVTVFDVQGRRVASIVDAELAAGAYTARWNGGDDQGARVSTGVYFARVVQGGATRTYKLVLLK